MYNLFVLFLEILIAIFMYAYIVKKQKQITVDPKKLDLIYISALLAVSVFAVAIRVYNGHNSGGDFSEYIAQARSIVEGTMQEQVSANTFIVTNSHFQFGPFAYPWGYPLLLAPMYKLFGMNYIAFKAVNCIFLVAMVVILYKVFSENLDKKFAFLAAALVAFIPVNLRLADNVLSDMTFCFFSVVSVYGIYRLVNAQKNQILWAVLVGATSFFAFFIRTAGIVSLITLFVADFISLVGFIIKPLKKFTDKFGFAKRSVVLRAVPYAVFAVGFAVIKLVFPQSDSGYSNYLSNLSIHSISSNILQYTISLKEMFDAGLVLSYILIALVAVLFVIGIVKGFFTKTVYIVYSFGMFALIMLFPEYQGIRYLISILPWIIMIAFSSVDFLSDKIKIEKGKFVFNFKAAFTAIICVAIVFSFYSSSVYLIDRIKSPSQMSTNHSYDKSSIELYDFIKENTDDSAVIVYSNPRLVWLNTERRSISIEEKNVDKFEMADYILVNTEYESYAKNHASATSDIKSVFSNDTYELYKIN